MSAVDHLVVTAETRESGAAFVASLLGVPAQEGGEHPGMGTHNALIRLGDSTYLEVIAADPSASAPARPRWFDLDRLRAGAPPRLATWVVRTDDIHAAALRSPVDPGPVEAASRGALAWLITIPPDGGLPLDGVAPSLIQWTAGEHPAATLHDSGCTLVELELRHPASAAIEAFLREIGFDGPLATAIPSPGRRSGLVARIRTPRGIRVLGEP